MKKVLLVFLVIGLAFVACGDGNTKRTRCNSDVMNSNGLLDTETCILFLSMDFGKPERQTSFNSILFQCLRYNLEMYKCEKKSNILPP